MTTTAPSGTNRASVMRSREHGRRGNDDQRAAHRRTVRDPAGDPSAYLGVVEPSAELNIGQNVDAIRDLIDAHLAGRSGTWIASFAELMAIADDRGVSIFAMQPTVTRRLAREGDGEQDDAAGREALKEALIGRWAADIARSRMNAMDPLVDVVEVEVIGESGCV